MSNDSDLIVVREEKSNAKVGKEIAAALKENFKMTVPELAEKINVPEDQIIHVLDSYHPTKGQIGAGKGHGWITDEQREKLVS